jgi:hypothetical protein
MKNVSATEKHKGDVSSQKCLKFVKALDLSIT